MANGRDKQVNYKQRRMSCIKFGWILQGAEPCTECRKYTYTQCTAYIFPEVKIFNFIERSHLKVPSINIYFYYNLNFGNKFNNLI